MSNAVSNTVPSRIKPVLGHDNKWWWDQAAAGQLVIQRCTSCQQLRHPPRPMCNHCQSMDWDYIQASGKGVICSYTVLHHPKFPGYDYPLVIILVDLEEGTRFTSQLIDCDPDAVDFGMAVEMVMQKDADGFQLPVFKLASK